MRQRMGIFLALVCLCIFVMAVSLVLAADSSEQTITVIAKKYQFTPSEIKVRQGVPVVLRITSQDALHGFSCPGLKIRTDVKPGQENVLRFTPDKLGMFSFHCDIFCGAGHANMTGTITVVP